jgi:hypothetical protein
VCLRAVDRCHNRHVCRRHQVVVAGAIVPVVPSVILFVTVIPYRHVARVLDLAFHRQTQKPMGSLDNGIG